MLALLAAAPLTSAQAKEAAPRVRIEVTSRIVAYDGRSFGNAGAYERIAAIAHLRIDPRNPANRGIADLALAPRAKDGLVDYDVDLVILRPRDAAKARRVMLYEVVNRGMKLFSMFTGGSSMGRGDPIDPGDGLLLQQGLTLVWSGWQGDITARGMVGARFPVAGSRERPVTGPVSTEIVFDNTSTKRMPLPYPPVSLDPAGGHLTVQARSSDAPLALPASAWRFDGEKAIIVDRPAGFDAGAIYRFRYTARDPRVMGLGFAATRDLIAFLRHGSAAQGNPLADLADAACEKTAKGACANPGGGVFSGAVAFGGSQSGRYLRDFLWQGFNRDLGGRRVFDGAVPFIPGARRTFTNVRFAEPGRFSRQHEDHDVPGFAFPFAYATLTDPLTGQRDGILKRCSASGTCPKVFHIDTSAEFWQAGASLVGTGGTGGDVPFPANVRAYMIAGGAHAPGMTSPACRYPANPFNYAPAVKALLVAMIDWSLDRKAPPASRWPSLDRGELVPVERLKGPGNITWAQVQNAPIPPAGTPGWPVFAPQVDADGNDLAGIHLPRIAAPDGTYLGWNLRKAGYGEGDLCFLAGSFVPFAKDAASRAPDDPRPSLAERNEAGRAAQMAAAARRLVDEGLLLESDAAAAAR